MSTKNSISFALSEKRIAWLRAAVSFLAYTLLPGLQSHADRAEFCHAPIFRCAAKFLLRERPLLHRLSLSSQPFLAQSPALSSGLLPLTHPSQRRQKRGFSWLLPSAKSVELSCSLPWESFHTVCSLRLISSRLFLQSKRKTARSKTRAELFRKD